MHKRGEHPIPGQIEREEIRLSLQRTFQHSIIGALRHFDCAEARQMRGHELGIEQGETARSTATRCTSATLDALRSRWNMLSPKNTRPRRTP